MLGRRGVHVYNQNEIDRLKGIALPVKLKCGRCRKNLPQARFSSKQLTDARWQISQSSNIYKAINCVSCTGQQVVEVECTMCGKTKGLEDFAKSQRCKPDTAKCFKCVEQQLAEEPFNEDRYEDLDKAFVTPDHSNGQYPEYFSAATTDTSSTYGNDDWNAVNSNHHPKRKAAKDGGIALSANFQQAMSISGSTEESLIDAGHAYTAGRGKNDDDSWSEVHTKSWHTQSNRAPSASSAFNPNAYRRSATSVAGSSHSFASSVAERSTTSEIRPNGWSKIRAAPRNPYVTPSGDSTRQAGPLVDAWSDSDDDGQEDDDDDSDDDTATQYPLLILTFAKERYTERLLIAQSQANNISAQEIRDSYQQRVRQAEQDAEQTGDNGEGPSNAGEDGEVEEDLQAESSAMAAERTRKRKRNQDEAIAKIKKGKAAKNLAKKKKKGSDDGSDFEDVMDMYKKAKPLPGQLENCEICNKRFTVTPYSKAGPDGGLLCTPCGKEMTKDAKAEKKATKPVVRKGRRKIESNRLDGMTVCGPKTLQQLCIEKLAKHSEDIDELGEMPENIMKRISEIFSKKRAMNPTTMKLFLQPDMEEVAIHEAAYLETEDYDQIFAVCPYVKRLSLRNCCQFKDSNIDYMNEKAKALEEIQLLGANLVSNEKWVELFIARGQDLKSLKVEWLDAAFDDQTVEALTTFCPNLERLKIERCKRLGPDSIDAIARLQHLKHLTLRFYDPITREKLVHLITSVGANLQTLCLEHFLDNTTDPTDDVLDTIHTNCNYLSKFRFTENNECTDAGYVNLFSNWANPPLHYIDVNSTRDMDNTNPDGPDDVPIGLASNGFRALMSHSGSRLEFLDISSCRHISHDTFSDVFDGTKQYPKLREINLSFCPVVDTQIVAGIFRSCPAIKKVVTFGCFQVNDVVVPRGIVLIGAPRAQDQIEQFGEVVLDYQREKEEEGEGMERMRRMGVGRVVPAFG
ncbi:dna repair protein rad7 [Stemphylium lycopersici]|uniref:Dna repair protein rad7 n=1 Tax=Stemphylium lycopersici TaxID=183478 RepID=A0A364NH45_STELY|nr:dna repair protein rad7 [Stemphylium lycopersici]RAR16433.1 dna repair protein rad7 [Stemphylium lycopersici]